MKNSIDLSPSRGRIGGLFKNASMPNCGREPAIPRLHRLVSTTLVPLSALMTPFRVFLALQLLDVATTLVVLKLGGAEQNPLIREFLDFGPALGLTLSKALVLGLAGLVVSRGKLKIIRLANAAFGFVVIWNVVIICRLLAAV
jgi:hypothetical protein